MHDAPFITDHVAEVEPTTMNQEMKISSDSLASALGEAIDSRENSLAELAVNSLPDLVYVVDREGRLLFWNRALAARTGYCDEELRLLGSEQFFPPEERQRVRASTAKAWQEGAASIQAHVLAKSGERIAYEFSSTLLRHSDGTPFALCGAARDLSERLAFETALRESELRSQALFESSRDAMMVIGDDGRFAAGNSSALEMFGCRSEEEFCLHTPGSFSPERQPDGEPSEEAAQKRIAKAMEEGSHFFDWAHCRADGSEFEASVLLTRIELEGQQHIHATVRDVSVERAIQRALRANEQKLRTITESALDAIVMVDAAGKIVHWNAAASTMFGYASDEVMGKDPHEILVPPGLQETARRGMAAFARHGTGAAVGRIRELTALHKTGRRFPIEVSISAVRADNGWAAVAVLRDISERRRLEMSLQKQTAELTAKVRELSCLERASNVFEKSHLAPREIVAQVVELLPNAVSEPENACARIVYHDYEIETPGFSETSMRLSVPLSVGTGLVGTLAVGYRESEGAASQGGFSLEERHLLEHLSGRLGRAIERYLSNAEIKSLNQKLELIFAATRTRFLLTDEDCIVRYADPETQRKYGSLANQKCSRYLFLSQGRCPGCPKETPEARDGTVVTHFTLPLEKDRIFQRTSVPIRSHSGELMFAAVLVDVTEHKALEVKLNQARKLEAVGELAAGIAHEINTPTQFVGDNTRFLREGFQDVEQILEKLDTLLDAAKTGTVDPATVEQIRAVVEEVDASYLRKEIPLSIEQALEGVGQIGKIVRAMKEFSHPGSKEKQAIDINRALENTLTVSRGEWKHVAELVTDFEPDLPSVPCFPADLNQAMLNIIVNAAHAITETESGHGTITVRTRQQDNAIVIEIEDTGCGVPADIRPRIFDHFFTTKEVGKGTGQGLTIAHSVIVENHGGTLDFESEVGKGTTFTIRLPLNDQRMEPQKPAPCTTTAQT